MITPATGSDGDRTAGRDVTWFHDAKLGIFLHWGLYSVPAWAPRVDRVDEVIRASGFRGFYRNNPYAEWYRNSYRVPGSLTAAHHRETYGARDYGDFVTEFDRDSGMADTDALADALKDAGAEYVVLTAKHHDGFLLWPSDRPCAGKLPRCARRDLVGDLATAVRKAGMRMGLYYSGGYDWSVYDRVLRRNADATLAMPVGPEYEQYASGHLRELIERYRPSVLWNDIGWPGGGNLAALVNDYYAQVPEGVVNDRWQEGPASRGPLKTALIRASGAVAQLAWPLVRRMAGTVGGTPPAHADFTTPEYQKHDEIQERKWEQSRGIGHSFAFNRNESAADTVSVEELVHDFVDVVSKNGNLLLGVGPRADGSIPAEQQRVLSGLGSWLRTNAEAIKGTRPWRTAVGRTDRGVPLRFTSSGGAVHVILLDSAPASGRHVIDDVAVSSSIASAVIPGVGPIPMEPVDGRVAVTLPERLPSSPAHVVTLRA